ncbi:2', 3'-cyclic nucleotide 2'-phosphodiesterase [Haloarcula vallismortis ATCC 29715]|uniref:2', 3'-cyclic nucleotide 2'-phosphodiesterase n=2 Tax=Haloarcula vallismortis TaxID=28442 RepID=M0JRF6_HALVA|nr:2', 3'-cyclic nucleotide 2'-phosphodiesterase [Haloarcula vallismortis ATCC 29715]
MTVEYDAEAGRLIDVAVIGQPIAVRREYRIAPNSYVIYSDDWPVPHEVTAVRSDFRSRVLQTMLAEKASLAG